MIVILANYGTTERVAVNIFNRKEIISIIDELNICNPGTKWIQVQDLKYKQGIRFSCEKTYKGFDNNPNDDYCGNLLSFTL